MLSSTPIAILAGALFGFLSGLGIGGGTILILWLTQVLHMDPDIARTINLMFFVTAAGSVSIVRTRKKQIPWRSILPAMAAGCVTSVVFSLLSRSMDTGITKKLFGFLLLLTGVRELFYRDK